MLSVSLPLPRGFAENFPPTLSGSNIFQVNLRQPSVYTFNATDEGDNFTVTISGNQPSNSTLVESGGLYTFTRTLQKLDNATITFLATDSLNAVTMLMPQTLLCACENDGVCTTEGLLTTDQDPLTMNCECQQGIRRDDCIWPCSKHSQPFLPMT